MHNIEIADARKFFWQWDTGCKLRLKGVTEGAQAHFYRDEMTEPLTVVSYALGEDIVCDIPDELLQVAETFAVYTYVAAEAGGKTYVSRAFPVKGRPKPVDYIYTPTALVTLEKAVEESLTKILDSGLEIGARGIVEVDALPTEKIDTTVFYSTAEGVYWYDGEWHKVTDESELESAIEAETIRATEVEKELQKNKQDNLSFDGEYNAETNKVATVKTVSDKVAEIVADAPEDFNTLKEMSDWIATHGGDATKMNSAILKNTEDISKNAQAIEEVEKDIGLAHDYAQLALKNVTSVVGYASEAKLIATETKQELNEHKTEQEIKDNAQDEALADFKARVETLLASDEDTLDELQEVVDYIKSNRSLIEGITTSKVNVKDIADDLVSNNAKKVLSANQGRILKSLIDEEAERATEADNEVKEYVDGLFVEIPTEGMSIPFAKNSVGQLNPDTYLYYVSDQTFTIDELKNDFFAEISKYYTSEILYTVNLKDATIEGYEGYICIKLSKINADERIYIIYDYTVAQPDWDYGYTLNKNGIYFTDSYYYEFRVSRLYSYGASIKKIDNNLLDLQNNADFKTVEGIAKGAYEAFHYDTLSEMVTELNALPNDKYRVDNHINIVDTDVPDFWVVEVADELKEYSYSNDEALVEDLIANVKIQVGYYVLARLETGKVHFQDYVKKTDYATDKTAGILYLDTSGVQRLANGRVYFNGTQPTDFNDKYNPNFARAKDSRFIVRYGITQASAGSASDNSLALNDEEKTSVKKWLDIVDIDKRVFEQYTDGTRGLTYEITEEVAECKGIGNATTSHIEIGSTFKGKPVTSIAASAFANKTNIRRAVIPDSITSISNSIFMGCLNLKRVNIGSGVTSIGKGAFYNCTSLTDVYFKGTRAQWETITIGERNDVLSTATIHTED